MNKALEALCYLDDIAHGRKMCLEPHELKLVVEKQLKALEIIKKYYTLEATCDEFFPYGLKDEQYISARSSKVMSKEEYDLLEEVWR